jgi:hypothetical protein
MTTEYVLLVTGPREEKLIPVAELTGEEGAASNDGKYVAVLNTHDPAVEAAMSLFMPAKMKADGGNEGYMYFCSPTQVDGGNGGGGGDGSSRPKELRVRKSFHEKSYWNFRVCPPGTVADEQKFPPLLRFEACLYFNNFVSASNFLNEFPKGSPRSRLQILGAVFQFVQLVAVTKQA